MHWEPLLMAFFLLVLLGGGLYVRMTQGRELPRIAEKWDSKRGRSVTTGRFEVALYKHSPGLWRAYAVTLDVGMVVALVAGIIACFRMAVTG